MSFNVPLLPSDLLHSRKHKYRLKQISCCTSCLWGGLRLEQQNQWQLVDIIRSHFINNNNNKSLAAVTNEAMHVWTCTPRCRQRTCVQCAHKRNIQQWKQLLRCRVCPPFSHFHDLNGIKEHGYSDLVFVSLCSLFILRQQEVGVLAHRKRFKNLWRFGHFLKAFLFFPFFALHEYFMMIEEPSSAFDLTQILGTSCR